MVNTLMTIIRITRALLYGVKWIGGLKISVKHRTMSDEN